MKRSTQAQTTQKARQSIQEPTNNPVNIRLDWGLKKKIELINVESKTGSGRAKIMDSYKITFDQKKNDIDRYYVPDKSPSKYTIFQWRNRMNDQCGEISMAVYTGPGVEILMFILNLVDVVKIGVSGHTKNQSKALPLFW